jgi:phosphohistidine phosphatase SixA
MKTKIMLKIKGNFTLLVKIVLLVIIVMLNSVNASDDLWDALKEGGKVVLMRHAPVQSGAESGNPLLRDSSCKNERNLSKQGRRNAQIVGSRFKEHNIPVSTVMHSPFCRTTDTAQIAFNKAFPAKYLSLIEILDPDQAVQQAEELNKIIGSYVGKENLILVTHAPNISAVSFELMKHLDFLVLEPKGKDEFEELGVVKFSD